jgi:hypothetical protein
MSSHSHTSIEHSIRHTSIQGEQLDPGAGTTATRRPSHLYFGARAAVLAGVVATACAAAAPAASPAAVAAPATHVTATATLTGPAGFITPADSSCCM